MIELINLHKTFSTAKALQGINLFIQEGEIFGIIGKSGAGKSTLLRSINLLEKPDKGEVIIDNQTITSLKGRALRHARHKMAMIFQHFNLLNAKNVYENIALPMRIQGHTADKIALKIKELLALVELTEKKDAFPSQLSGGQKQRVAIARALSCSPKILLCDEATSALDPETTDSILQLLKKINQLYGITIALITHEMDVIKRICHRLAIMEAGKIVELTSLANVFNEPKSLARNMLYKQLTPPLPASLLHSITTEPTSHALIRLFFQGEAATVPFISQTSRELSLDINILLANVDRFEGITCGVIIIEVQTDEQVLAAFIERCKKANLTVEILGYVADSLI